MFSNPSRSLLFVETAHKTMAAQQAALLAATAEIMRAPYRPTPLAAPAPELRNADGSDGTDEDDDRDDEIDDEPQPESTLISVARMVDATMPNMAAQLGEFLYEKVVEMIGKKKKRATSAAAMPVAAAAPTAPETSHASPPPAVPADTVRVASPAHEHVAHAEAPASAAPVATPTSVVAGTGEQLETAVPYAADEVPTEAPPVPTPAQMAHLFAIRERLDAKERAIAEAAIHRMTPEQLAHWLGELSELSIEDATTTIRELIAQIRHSAPRPPQQ